ncbi:MAG TPA: aldose epimerase family protein [Bryobacteraceae bacterium]|jgi:galactose mutarotase-like enzyme|nr:aldose epimerase family protein [Bryobacteraceae bacterium]
MTELTKQRFGALPAGEEIFLYRFSNGNGLAFTVTNFGGRIVNIWAPDREGKREDIALGFDTLDGYVHKNPYFGALVGRYANRIANGRFTLDGQVYQLPVNNPPNTLHGGFHGFDSVPWKAAEVHHNGSRALQLEYLSRDGEEGFPGNLQTTVLYSVTESNELRIDFHATTDKKTVLNLTNHSYFDLAGQGKGSVLDHVVTINADRYVPIDEHLIPTGALPAVAGTPFDFRTPRRIGERIDDPDPQLKLALGYDHTFVLSKDGANGPGFAAKAVEPKSGRTLEVYTTQPGVQFYTGNHLTGNVTGKGGVVYAFRTGFCLETQSFPDSPNHPDFPSTELAPGDDYRSTTIYRFSAE